jgi:hypothetical protein
MFEKFLGKGSKSGGTDDATNGTKQGADADQGFFRGLFKPETIEVVEDDPDTMWSMWDSAVSEMDSRFLALPPDEPPASAASKPDARPVVNAVASPDNKTPSTSEATTEPMGLTEKTPEQRKSDALGVIEQNHSRIFNTIKVLWGHKECADYIDNLIMSGGDGFGQVRRGFNQESADALMVLSTLHEQEFGRQDNVGGLGFNPNTGFGGLSGTR